MNFTLQDFREKKLFLRGEKNISPNWFVCICDNQPALVNIIADKQEAGYVFQSTIE